LSAYSRSSRVIKSAHFFSNLSSFVSHTISRFFAHQTSENSENVEQERSLSNRDDHQQWCHYRSSQEKSKEVSSSTRIDKMSIERVGRRARTRTSSRRRTRPVVRFSRVQRVWVSRATTHGIFFFFFFCDEREKRTRVRSDQTRRKRRMRVDVTFAFRHRG